MTLTSRELLTLKPGARIIDDEGRDYCVVGQPKIVGEGKPGPGRVRIEAIPLSAKAGKAIADEDAKHNLDAIGLNIHDQIRDWVERRGWYKSLFYFHTRVVRGDHVTSLELDRYKR